ncbi:MAG: hypothetical protein Q8R61_02730 [Thiobacillus sp.]|uniref:hypothetical protein n=1 Tax=Thiobacillus sp. TaxID=924 RepID=UPI002736AFCD|nr:hypothetical protein [Thiobacillus sp.]MDP3584012.1 hypothetical protein [Thiobacillus sp.]
MNLKTLLFAGLVLTLGACATQPDQPPARSTPAGLNTAALSGELARVAALTGEQRRRELAALENERRLDDGRRFLLAALLEREDSVDALERSLKTLGAIGEADARTQALLELMKKSLRARIELRQQTLRAQELQDKLDQIKALEKSLQQRATPPRTP